MTAKPTPTSSAGSTDPQLRKTLQPLCTEISPVPFGQVTSPSSSEFRSGPVLVHVTVEVRKSHVPDTTRPKLLKLLAGLNGSLWQHFDDAAADDDDFRAVTLASEDATGVFITRGSSKAKPQRLRVVDQAAAQVYEQLTADARSAALPQKRLAENAELLVKLVRKLSAGTDSERAQLFELVKDRDVADSDAAGREHAEDRAQARAQRIYRRIRTECYSIEELSPYIKSRQRLKQLRDKDQLFALKTPYERGLIYPKWQFTDMMQPREDVPRLIAAAKKAGLNALTFHQLMAGTRDEGPSGAELVASGETDAAIALVDAADRTPRQAP